MDHLKKEAELQEKIQEKKDLLKKVKQALMYQPSEHQGVEKSSQNSRARLHLSYNWPLLHVSGKPLEDEETSAIFFGTEVLDEMMKIRTCSLSWTLEPEAVRGCKRKFDQDDFFCSKRPKMHVPALMIGYDWPLVLHQKPKSWSITVNINIPPSTSPFAPLTMGNQAQKVCSKRKLEEENVDK